MERRYNLWSSKIPISNSGISKDDHSMTLSKDKRNGSMKDKHKDDITTFNNTSVKDGHSMTASKEKRNETMKDTCTRDITTFNNTSGKDDNSMTASKDKRNETMKRHTTNISDCYLKDDHSMRLSKSQEKENINNVVPLPRPLPSVSHSLTIFDSAKKELIRKLVLLQKEYESPSEDSLIKVTPFSLGVTEEAYINRFIHVIELIILTVEKIVHFSIRVPGFETICKGDQHKLLKGCCTEVLLLRLARKYDLRTDSTNFGFNCPYKREIFHSSGMGHYADSIFNFCRNLRLLNINNSEYALLTAVVIFSKRKYLLEKQKIKNLHKFYKEILKAYVDINRSAGNDIFDKLISNLAYLRKLGSKNSQRWFSTKIHCNEPSQLLSELLDN